MNILDIKSVDRSDLSNTDSIEHAHKESIVTLWILRFLIPLGAHQKFVGKQSMCNEPLAQYLGLQHWIDPEDKEYEPKAIRIELREMHEIAEKNAPNLFAPEILTRNIAKLSKLIGLSEVDCRILEFVVFCGSDLPLESTANLLGDLSTSKLIRVIATVLALPEQDVRTSLSSSGLLERSDLVSVDRHGNYDLESKMDVLSRHFSDRLLDSDVDPMHLLRNSVIQSEPAKLKLDHYPHISDYLNILLPYLKASLSQGHKGVNILIYGEPGTGKSQLAKVISAELNVKLFEVASKGCGGRQTKSAKRLRAYNAAQKIFSTIKSIIAFDEIEDIFGDGYQDDKGSSEQSKAWLNRLLEENAVPTLWISNSIWGLDPAYIRRFDMVVELSIPTRKQRREILSDYCGEFLSTEELNHISNCEQLAPAVVTRASRVIKSIQGGLSTNKAATAFKKIINSTLEGQGHNPIPKSYANALPATYDFRYIHADTDIEQLSKGLIQAKTGRLCLYGPPGTGKTAYGRWLAEAMEAPLLVKRGSDLISKWVGGTEKNIAKAFEEAEQEAAVLLIDEVDGFLQDRRNARQSWEVSGVNEMLTQMESYNGVLIASTNLLGGLDQAALRRFDLKVKFDFILPSQAWGLLLDNCSQLGITKPSDNLKPELNRLKNVTPGDYSAVVRRHRFQPLTTAQAMVSALKAECDLKEGNKNTIGFIQ